MGWLSKIGKGLLLGGGALAAPFTGGASLAGALGLGAGVGAGASTIGGILSGMGTNAGAVGAGMGSAAAAAAANRGNKQASLFKLKDQLEQQLLAREQEARAGIGEQRTAESHAIRQALVSAGLLEWRPATRPGNNRPGINYSIPNISFTDGPGRRTRAVANTAYDRATGRLGELPNEVYRSNLPEYTSLRDDPEYQETLDPSGWEKAGGIGSFVAPIAGSIIEALLNRRGATGSTENNPEPNESGVPPWRDWTV